MNDLGGGAALVEGLGRAFRGSAHIRGGCARPRGCCALIKLRPANVLDKVGALAARRTFTALA